MAKKAFGRKKGIERGVLKHRVGRKGKNDEENNNTAGHKFFGISPFELTTFGEKCFDFSLVCCEKLYLIGFRRTENGEYVLLGPKAKLFHYASILTLLSICLQRTWGTMEMFLYQETRMQTFMCLCLIAVYIVALLAGMGVLMRPQETIDLLNSWSRLSDSLKMIDPCSNFHPLDNMSACMKLIADFLVHHGCMFGIGFVSLFIEDTPVQICETAERYGLIPEGILPNWVWKFCFMPLECLIVWPFMLVASFAGSCLFMEIAALDECLLRLGSMNIHSLQSRQQMEQMYVQFELFNRIAQVWTRYFFPTWLVGLSSAVIVGVFFTVRCTEVPLVIYMVFPYAAVTIMILIFWQSYDMLRVIRLSENILGQLLQHHAPYFQGMTRKERVEKVKRSRAMRTLVFPLADSEFSVSLPINTWDEILNQTLFLLSL